MALTKTIKGKKYYFDSVFKQWDKDRAYKQAEKLRKAGNQATVKKEGDEYIVWVR